MIVDDSLSVRDARQLWLREATDAQVDALDFEGALALGTRWGQVDIAVLDGHDRRSPERRAAAARRSGVDSIPAHDHFPGARLAQEVRRHTTAGVTSIILISAYARENELISRRIVQAGVDYVFDHFEVDQDRETFVRAVTQPWTFSSRRASIDWAALGYERAPDVQAAIDIAERRHGAQRRGARRAPERRVGDSVGASPAG
ncbi:hypothetical protein [Arsenicicoccus bolidensis]|uniref:Response regulator n=1 Tax=Arsenicicoccus bolidensis TaxID=229480 RepID=A0ABS9PXJ2_9MICO|nr:hypothetical protein [Arsenicicoccus bolidensis]MCG7320346.1 hypothetical protein [Arsenicicoccus bolidensis]